jgi:hypothetical protein
LLTWTRRLTLRGSEEEYKVRYLRHENGTIITSQRNAWNDGTRMAMYIDLILIPEARRLNGMALWMDNFSGHGSETVLELMRTHQIDPIFSPANTTHLLQPLDLVVNGPIKRFLRKRRADELYLHFQEFRQKHYEAVATGAGITHFQPSKPQIDVTLNALIFYSNGALTSTSMKASVKASFQSTGCYSTDGIFTRYKESMELGSMSFTSSLTVDGALDAFEEGDDFIEGLEENFGEIGLEDSSDDENLDIESNDDLHDEDD